MVNFPRTKLTIVIEEKDSKYWLHSSLLQPIKSVNGQLLYKKIGGKEAHLCVVTYNPLSGGFAYNGTMNIEYEFKNYKEAITAANRIKRCKTIQSIEVEGFTIK